MAMVIFTYTGSPQVKILQKVLGGYFFDSHCSFVVRSTLCPQNVHLFIFQVTVKN